jgi:hypothetical protein
MNENFEQKKNEALNKTDVMQLVLKASDLRLNNYIQSGNNGKYISDGIVGKILEIGNEERVFEQIYCECEESFDWFFKDNYFGIPLTEQWILKLGFTWSIPHQAHYKEGFDYVIDFYETYPNVDGCLAFINKNHRSGDKLITVKFVHELQNLHYVLTQRELTVA